MSKKEINISILTEENHNQMGTYEKMGFDRQEAMDILIKFQQMNI